MPDENITAETLQNSIQKVKVALQEWHSFDKNAHFTHPYFGKLNKKIYRVVFEFTYQSSSENYK